MKELSIEQKAQRYDEALKRANAENKDEDRLLKAALERIFPELKESEDEKIRMGIISGMKALQEKGKYTCFANIPMDIVFTWLEKQGEHRLYVNDNAKEMFIKALERVEEQNNKGYKLTDCDKNSLWEDFKNYTSCTIEQKPILDFKAKDWYVSKVDGKIHNMTYNPTDKVEPKSQRMVSAEAKEAMYDKPTDEEMKELLRTEYEKGRADAIAEAKVEQKPAEEYNDEDYGIDGLYHAQRILEKTLGKVDGYQSDDGILEHRCAISAVKKLYEQKSDEWSEEDENNLYLTTVAIEREYSGELFLDPKKVNEQVGIGMKLINWLRSFKNRVQSQQVWKPTEEQMRALHDLNLTGNISYAGQGQTLIELYEQLKMC